MQTIDTLKTAPATTVIIGKFNGAFSQFQATAFTDLKAAGFAENVAHEIASDYGSDIGNAVRNGDDFGSKIANAKQDGTARISISGKGNAIMSNTMALLRVCQVQSSLKAEKLVNTHKIDTNTLCDDVQSYIKAKLALCLSREYVAKWAVHAAWNPYKRFQAAGFVIWVAAYNQQL